MTTTLLELTLPRTLDSWVAQYAQADWHGATIEGWLFEGLAARRAAQAKLAAAGVRARLRSAYKPLVHFFLEEVDAASLAHVCVRYPVHRAALPNRFLLEAYPLAALLPEGVLVFEAGGESTDYEVEMTFKTGLRQSARVFAPNREHLDATGATALSPTGWLRLRASGAATCQCDAAHETEYERLFAEVLTAARQFPWPEQEPYFQRLNIEVEHAGIEQILPVGHEAISSAEALHEDIYFSLLEIFQKKSGREPADRRLQPGQIVPDVRAGTGAARVCMTLRDFDVAAQDQCAAALPDSDSLLGDWSHAPHPRRIADVLRQLGGRRFGATSVQGRRVAGCYLAGPGAAVLVSGGQHANETSGVVGALRAAQILAAEGSAHLAVIALENPDGYALHRELVARQPRHMHHAARYSALGDDIEYRQSAPFHERAARSEALALSAAQLHVNLHGYPAHEWTRPLSGYVPRGFGLWTIPKGFFLVLRHQAGWQREGQVLLERVCHALSLLPGLLDYNAAQLALYRAHAGTPTFDMRSGIPCTLTEDNSRPGAPVTLITEIPDETVDGDAFRFAHAVQTALVLAAVSAWQDLARS